MNVSRKPKNCCFVNFVHTQTFFVQDFVVAAWNFRTLTFYDSRKMYQNVITMIVNTIMIMIT